ncbi:MAG: sulfate reduction electron transfer complex DsrMKJOP subunit DsrJ [Desulfosporosinus sp.]|nr:sulfate reduction electron transfer complex DsrMKJOP subunit DsrJ [Desulfosporosinus sp.]
MYKGGRIIASLIIFVAFLTLPFFFNLGKANAGPDLPTYASSSDSQCVEPAAYMKANHMQLLLKWRDSDVRDGNSVYINSQGKSFDISLETCVQCHTTQATKNTVGVNNPALNTSDQFCVSCHNYASVKPTCWNCHSGPEGATK